MNTSDIKYDGSNNGSEDIPTKRNIDIERFIYILE